MKSVFMVLFLLGGLCISNVDAQACKPSPPGCCASASKKGANVDANTAQTLLPGSNALAACTPEQLAACTPEQIAACESKKMSKKEMKECQAICQPLGVAAPSNKNQIAASPVAGNGAPTATAKSIKQ